MSTTATTGTTTAPASTRFRWRVIDIVVAAVLGVVVGLVFFLWDQIYSPVATPLDLLLGGAGALTYGIWLLGGPLGALVIRKPGAAIFVELVAAVVEALLGAKWGGLLTLESGLVQGLGAEIVFAILLYKQWNVWVAILAGAVAGLAEGVNDWILWNAEYGTSYNVVYLVSAIISGAILAGLLGWAITRGLARTGALNRFASGREAARKPAAAAA